MFSLLVHDVDGSGVAGLEALLPDDTDMCHVDGSGVAGLEALLPDDTDITALDILLTAADSVLWLQLTSKHTQSLLHTTFFICYMT